MAHIFDLYKNNDKKPGLLIVKGTKKYIIVGATPTEARCMDAVTRSMVFVGGDNMEGWEGPKKLMDKLKSLLNKPSKTLQLTDK